MKIIVIAVIELSLSYDSFNITTRDFFLDVSLALFFWRNSYNSMWRKFTFNSYISGASEMILSSTVYVAAPVQMLRYISVFQVYS